jgi:hypothetical protein
MPFIFPVTVDTLGSNYTFFLCWSPVCLLDICERDQIRTVSTLTRPLIIEPSKTTVHVINVCNAWHYIIHAPEECTRRACTTCSTSTTPRTRCGGSIVWARSVSIDLIDWTVLDPGIYPSKPFNINDCWPGSATLLPNGVPVTMYTGIDPRKRQVQNVAYPKVP